MYKCKCIQPTNQPTKQPLQNKRKRFPFLFPIDLETFFKSLMLSFPLSFVRNFKSDARKKRDVSLSILRSFEWKKLLGVEKFASQQSTRYAVAHTYAHLCIYICVCPHCNQFKHLYQYLFQETISQNCKDISGFVSALILADGTNFVTNFRFFLVVVRLTRLECGSRK